MINTIYQLIRPRVFSQKYDSVETNGKVIVKPNFLAVCHADQRYFMGLRDSKILRHKLPMALIHEGCGIVLKDDTNTFKPGQKVVMIPNIPSSKSSFPLENYALDSKFMSSNCDGFMSEIISFDPDRLIAYDDIDDVLAPISEFVSVAVHSINRFEKISHEYKKRIAVFGDGSMGFVVANLLKILYPKSKICVVGLEEEKLSRFSFVDERYYADNLPSNFSFDHGFECCGGDGSISAIRDLINYIKPQGTIMLLGVSENEVAINTRLVLEKGLTLLGTSRSGRSDFEKTIELMKNKAFQNRLRTIIYESIEVNQIEDLYTIFETDLNTSFKTVFKWNM